MKSTIDTDTSAAKEYRWKGDGKDGLRSYSYNSSNPAWNYSTEPSNSNVDSDGAYIFSDSSTGQPSARRGNLYNLTAATLGSSLGPTTEDHDQATDSICPRGWQLPIDDWQANKSWAKLLDSTYGVKADTNGVNRAREWPLEYLPTGYYAYGNGYIGSRMTDGRWWSGVNYGSNSGDGADLWLASDIFDIEDASRGWGFALRCVRRSFRQSLYHHE